MEFNQDRAEHDLMREHQDYVKSVLTALKGGIDWLTFTTFNVDVGEFFWRVTEETLVSLQYSSDRIYENFGVPPA